jgi:hypothetical protein
LWHVWETGEVHIECWWEDLREGDHVEDLRRRWEYDIKVDIREVGCGDMEWIDLAEDTDKWWAHVNAVINFRVP